MLQMEDGIFLLRLDIEKTRRLMCHCAEKNEINDPGVILISQILDGKITRMQKILEDLR
jgi:hypothetical protein